MAPKLLTKLKAKLKAIFKKKDKSGRRDLSDTPQGDPAITMQHPALAAEEGATADVADPATGPGTGAATEANPGDKTTDTALAASHATAQGPGAGEIGIATDTKPVGGT